MIRPVLSLIGINSFGGTNPLRMIPTDQGLKADERRVIKPDYRLVIQLKFVSLDRKPKVGLKLQAGNRSDVHFLVEDNVIFLVILRIIHRDISVSQDVFGFGILGVAVCDTDLGAGKYLPPVECVRLCETFCQTVGKACCFFLA